MSLTPSRASEVCDTACRHRCDVVREGCRGKGAGFKGAWVQCLERPRTSSTITMEGTVVGVGSVSRHVLHPFRGRQ